MNNKEVAHLWANKSRERATGSHFYFDGDTIYSYGSHFPIARHYKGVVLFTTESYSSTTAKHKGYVRRACSHLPIFYVSKVMENPSGATVKELSESVQSACKAAARARNLGDHLAAVEHTIKRANDFCERFGFKTRFAMPENWDELQAKAKIGQAKERKAKAERLAKQEAEAQETIGKWLAGESVTIPHFIGKVYLRTKYAGQDSQGIGSSFVMETSKGARVPMSEAQKTFRFVTLMRARGWHRNGDQFKIGDYQLDAVNDQGVVAGCHRIAWDEIERFAKAQGWI